MISPTFKGVRFSPPPNKSGPQAILRVQMGGRLTNSKFPGTVNSGSGQKLVSPGSFKHFRGGATTTCADQIAPLSEDWLNGISKIVRTRKTFSVRNLVSASVVPGEMRPR